MSDPKRPEKRRSATSRPGRAGETERARPRRSAAVRRGPGTSRSAPESPAQPVQRSTAAEQRAELRVGFTARRAVILAAVMCVLTLTLAGPVRTFFAQHAEMKQQSQLEATLRGQIADLQQQKANMDDPAHIRAQARERLGFVMPGEIPYQVQLPAPVEVPGEPGTEPLAAPSGDPWYTALWHTIADVPHPPPPPGPPGLPVPPAPVVPVG
ncbi:FtsB family cell division protein [Mycolicibacter sinensis]|uniref:Septation inhibitor protein n=1 Tax=Mycolicibacter sinensis (strain JDM601) TaxID=875328 RepID=A0A1A2EBJ1_MYCSD|nr:septum formation initiator family protein [Mycolicibacter sinensis]OBG01470.1 septation inhibitor protein [Mycolicibacter sinensis]OBG10878.1 septation inhibitor protein [Mycolicibacter sinensis]